MEGAGPGPELERSGLSSHFMTSTLKDLQILNNGTRSLQVLSSRLAVYIRGQDVKKVPCDRATKAR